MRKNNKKLKLFSLIFLILFCVYFQTIVYSALSSTMTITGDAYARAVKDVRITNFKLNSSSTNSTSSYEEFGVNTISTKFNLVDSSSSIVFDVEVTNYGSADVGILQLIGTVPTGLSYEIINYNLKDKICDDTGKCNQMAVKTFQIKFTGTPGEYELTKEFEFRTYHKVIYTDITNNNYPTEVIDGGNLIITFKEDLKKVTILSNGNEIDYYDQISNGQTITIENVSSEIEIKQEVNLINVVSGDGTKTSDEVCIGEECFYVMYSDDTTVTMLSKYNLYVGGEYNSGWTAYGDEATGIQDSNMLGFVPGQTIRKGTTMFSNTNYWSSTVSSYPVYVYNSNSTLYSYVENYKTYLSTLGVTPTEARLITKDELTSDEIGCSDTNYTCKRSAYPWIYSTSYWSGSAFNASNVWIVFSNGDFYDIDYSNGRSFGVRPVIIISKSNF